MNNKKFRNNKIIFLYNGKKFLLMKKLSELYRSKKLEIIYKIKINYFIIINI